MEFFAPMRKRREELLKDPGYIEDVLKKGAERANAVAARTMEKVYKTVGLRKFQSVHLTKERPLFPPTGGNRDFLTTDY